MNESIKVGFCVSGEGRLFRAAANAASDLGIQIALLVLEAKASPDLEEFCSARAIPLHRLNRKSRPEFDDELLQVCTRVQLDLLILTFDKLLPAALVRHYTGRIINVHPALLPAFKGMRALEQTVASGARYAGASIHEVDEQMDHGPIIAQCVVGLHETDSASDLGQRLFPFLRDMYLQVIAWYAEKRITRDAQGRLWVRGGVYGGFPVSPALERKFSGERAIK